MNIKEGILTKQFLEKKNYYIITTFRKKKEWATRWYQIIYDLFTSTKRKFELK